MKIYDCFSFFNELDMLELRLEILGDHVDKFVLVESTKSHQNFDKPLFYEENKQRFSKFNDKITHVVVNDFPPHSYWSHETHQRDCIVRGLSDCKKEDVIFVSDLDEIWNPEKIIPKLDRLKNNEIMNWKSKICYFYFNLVADSNPWYQPFYIRHELLQELLDDGFTLSVDILRDQEKRLPIKHTFEEEYGGWHFSYTEDVEYKLQNFLHSEYRNMKKEQIDEFIKNKVNPFHKNQMELIPPSEFETYLPKYVFNNLEKYREKLLYD